jgi:hypothetical protein
MRMAQMEPIAGIGSNRTENAMKKRTPTETGPAMPWIAAVKTAAKGLRAIQAYLDHKASLVPQDQWGLKASHPRPS